MRKITIPKEEVLYYHSEYVKSYVALYLFSRQTPYTHYTLKKAFIEHSLPIFTRHASTYPVDHNYFDLIDSESKAYFLGLLYADGCNVKGNNAVILALAEQDIDLLQKFSSAIGYDFHGKPFYRKNPNAQPMYRVEVYSKQMSESLARYGCVPQKTFIIKFPENPPLPENLINHFVRGYFDGDGCLSFYKAKKDKFQTIQAELSITSTFEICESIKQQLSKLQIHSYISKRHKDRPNNNFSIKVGGKLQIRKACDLVI